MGKLELIDEKFEIEFEWSYEVPDFKLISTLVRWCDSYTRNGILVFHFLKDCTCYAVYLTRDKQLPEYIKSMFIYIRKPKHRLDWEDKKIKEFKEFILTKFKKANPKILKQEIRNSSQD